MLAGARREKAQLFQRSLILALVVAGFAGFLAAFISGLVACRWMINIVKSGKLIYFALYCFLLGTIAITSQYL